MKKYYYILLAIIVVAVIAIVLVMKYYPVWVTLQNFVVLAVGIALGWFANLLYRKFRKERG